MTELPKKRGRRKKLVTDEDVVKTSKKNESKININSIQFLETTRPRKSNIILHLRCSLKDIDDYTYQNNWKSNGLMYNPKVPNEVKPYEPDNEYHLIQNKENEDKKSTLAPFFCNKCLKEMNETNVNMDLNEQDKDKIKSLKKQFYCNEIPDKKVDCFWCTSPYDNDSCHILQYGSNGTISAYGSYCSPECAVAYLFKNTSWDDSTKMESYQLMNQYYSTKKNNSIKPAPSPFYFLDKYFGNMTIQEFRRMSKSSHIMLCVEKPVTRVLPEIHEDNDDMFVNGTTNISRGSYKVKKQSEKSQSQNRNSIIRDAFGVSNS